MPDPATTIGFVSQDTPGPQPGTPSSDPLDRALLHQHFELCGFVTLTSSEHTGHWFPFAFDPQMQFCAETTLTLA
jgi:hypothetical protein